MSDHASRLAAAPSFSADDSSSLVVPAAAPPTAAADTSNNSLNNTADLTLTSSNNLISASRTPTVAHSKSKSYERHKRPSLLFQPFTDYGVHRPSLLLNTPQVMHTPQSQQQGHLHSPGSGQKQFRYGNALSADPLLQPLPASEQQAQNGEQTPYHRVTASLSGMNATANYKELHSPSRKKNSIISSKPVTAQQQQQQLTGSRSQPTSPNNQISAQVNQEKSYSKAISESVRSPATHRPSHSKRASTIDNNAPEVAIPISQVYIVFMCLTTCLGMSALDTTIVNVAAPTITQEFGSFQLFGWLTSAYMLASSAFTPIYGKASDIFGRSMAMQVAISFFFVGSLLGALAPTMTVLIVSRGLQGIGGAGLNSLTSVIVGDMLVPAEQGRYIYILSISYTFFSVIGPIVGGVFTDAVSWRFIFWLNLPICFVSSLIVHFYMRGIPIRQRRVHSVKDVDWLGSITVLSATGCLVFAVISGGSTFPWQSLPIILTLSAAGVLILLFIYSQHKAGHRALMPLHMYMVRNFSLANGIMFLCGAVSFGISSYLPSYFESVVKDSALVSGLRTLPFVGCTVLATTLSGQIIARTGHYYSLPLIGSPLQLLGCVMLAVYLTSTISYVWLSLTMAAIGLGVGLTQPVMNVLIQLSVPVADMAAGVTSGLFFRQLGGACGVAVCSSIFNNLYTQQLVQLTADRHLPALPANAVNYNNDQIAALGPATVSVFADSYVAGLSTMYFAVAAFAGLTCVLCYMMQKVEIPSRGKPPSTQPNNGGSGEMDSLEVKSLTDPTPEAHNGAGALSKSALAYHVDATAARKKNAVKDTVLDLQAGPVVLTEVERMVPVNPSVDQLPLHTEARMSMSSPVISTDGLTELSHNQDAQPHSPMGSMRSTPARWHVVTSSAARLSHNNETAATDDVTIDVASVRNSPALHLRLLQSKKATAAVKSTRSIQTQTPPLPMLQLDRIYLPTGYEPTATNNHPAFSYAANHSTSSASPATETRLMSPTSSTVPTSVVHSQPLFTPISPRVQQHTSAPAEQHQFAQQSHSRQVAHHESSPGQSPAELRRERLRAMTPTPLIVPTHPPENANTLGLHSIKRANIPLTPSPRASGQSLPLHVMHSLRSNAASRAGSMRNIPINTMQQLSPRVVTYNIDESFNPLNSIK